MRRAMKVLTPPVRDWVADTFGALTPPQAARYPCALVGENVIVLPAFSEWAGGTSAGRLLESLPPGEWRALPVSGGQIADMGIVIGRSDRPTV